MVASNAEHRVRQDRRAQLHPISILLCCLLLCCRALQGLDCRTRHWSSVTHPWREKQGTALEWCHRAPKREKSGSAKHVEEWKRLGWEGGALAGLLEQERTEQEA